MLLLCLLWCGAAQEPPAARTSCSCDGCQSSRGEHANIFGLAIPNISVSVKWTHPYPSNVKKDQVGVSKSLGCSSNGDLTVCAIPGAGVVCLSSKGSVVYNRPAVVDTITNQISAPVVSGALLNFSILF